MPSNEHRPLFQHNCDKFYNYFFITGLLSEWRLHEHWFSGVEPQARAPALGEHLPLGVPALPSLHGGGLYEGLLGDPLSVSRGLPPENLNRIFNLGEIEIFRIICLHSQLASGVR